jgi:hypothetical protein
LDEVYLTDLNGKIIANYKKISKGQFKIDLADKPVGIFFIKYRIEDAWGSFKIMRKA